jgi:hypothetical protein
MTPPTRIDALLRPGAAVPIDAETTRILVDYCRLLKRHLQMVTAERDGLRKGMAEAAGVARPV